MVCAFVNPLILDAHWHIQPEKIMYHTHVYVIEKPKSICLQPPPILPDLRFALLLGWCIDPFPHLPKASVFPCVQRWHFCVIILGKV